MVHNHPSYSNNEFYVVTRIAVGCSLGSLHFICSVQANTVTTLMLTLLSVIHVILWYLCFMFLNMIFIIASLYMCILEPQKLRVRLGACKTSLNPQ